jgi:phosphoribosylglycinamide formyltransferase-1
MSRPALPVVVLVSGRGSNLQAILDATDDDRFPAEVRAVVSNVPGVHALERARGAGIEASVVDHRDFDRREAFDAALRARIELYAPGLVVLAGFMRVLTPEFIAAFAGRLINIHPSLLPRHPGLDTHQRALDAGDTEHGVTVHFVSAALDAGPIIAQARVRVDPRDDAERLAARVLVEEHRLLPRVIAWFAEGRLVLENGVALLDGHRAHPV